MAALPRDSSARCQTEAFYAERLNSVDERSFSLTTVSLSSRRAGCPSDVPQLVQNFAVAEFGASQFWHSRLPASSSVNCVCLLLIFSTRLFVTARLDNPVESFNR